MRRVPRTFIVLASAVVVATSITACGQRSAGDSASAGLLAPSGLGESGTAALSAKGGGKGGGKPGGGGTTGSSLTLVMVTDQNADGHPNWADTVTFNVSTTATAEPTVSLQCTQNGVAVYGATSGFYEGYPWPWTQNMTLLSGVWQGGAADCTAILFPNGSRSTVLATVKFVAGA